MSEEEYVVESILRAKVVSKRGKKVWNYFVKWKGYDKEEDNTWEPTTSFSGSEHFIDTFWARVRDDRDYHDISSFKKDEVIYPTGPPRGAKKSKAKAKPKSKPEADKESSPGLVILPAPKATRVTSEDEVRSLIDDESEPASRAGTKKRPNSSIAEDGPSAKRRRDQKSPAVTRVKRKRSLVKPSTPPETPPPTAKSSRKSIKRKPSTESIPDSESPQELSLELGVEPASARQQVIDVDKERSPSIHGSLFDGDGEDIEVVTPPPAPAPAPSTSKDSTKSKPKSTIPAHRLRQANPRVQMVDEELVGNTFNKAIPIKSRIAARNLGLKSPKQQQVAGPSKPKEVEVQVAPKKPAARPKSKPGPGRSSTGMQLAGSSLLSKPKAALAAVNQSVRALVDRAKGAPSASAEEVDEEGDDDIEVLSNRKAEGANGGTVSGVDEGLPDFDDGADAMEVDEPSGTAGLAEEPKVNSELAANPSVVLQPAWKQTTIFGPLGYGRGAEGPLSPTEGPNGNTTPGFSITFDSSASAPVILKDVYPATDPLLKPLNEILSNGVSGPTGKFYKAGFALALAETLRTGGSWARVVLSEAANEVENKHFIQFRERLRTGDLFVAVIGETMVAFISATDATLGPQLKIVPALAGLGDNLVATEVAIENDMAYFEAISNADDSRWES